MLVCPFDGKCRVDGATPGARDLQRIDVAHLDLLRAIGQCVFQAVAVEETPADDRPVFRGGTSQQVLYRRRANRDAVRLPRHLCGGESLVEDNLLQRWGVTVSDDHAEECRLWRGGSCALEALEVYVDRALRFCVGHVLASSCRTAVPPFNESAVTSTG